MERVFDSSSYIASVHLFTWVCLGAMVLLVYPIYNHTNTLRRLETELRAQILDLKPLEKDASPPASVPAPAPPVMHVRDQLLHALQEYVAPLQTRIPPFAAHVVFLALVFSLWLNLLQSRRLYEQVMVLNAPTELRLFDPESGTNYTVHWKNETRENKSHFLRPYVLPYIGPSSNPDPEVFRGVHVSPIRRIGTPENLAPLRLLVQSQESLPLYFNAIGLNFRNIFESIVLDAILCKNPDLLRSRYRSDPQFYLGQSYNITVKYDMLNTFDSLNVSSTIRAIEGRRYNRIMRIWGPDSCLLYGLHLEVCQVVREKLRSLHKFYTIGSPGSRQLDRLMTAELNSIARRSPKRDSVQLVHLRHRELE